MESQAEIDKLENKRHNLVAELESLNNEAVKLLRQYVLLEGVKLPLKTGTEENIRQLIALGEGENVQVEVYPQFDYDILSDELKEMTIDASRVRAQEINYERRIEELRSLLEKKKSESES